MNDDEIIKIIAENLFISECKIGCDPIGLQFEYDGVELNDPHQKYECADIVYRRMVKKIIDEYIKMKIN